MSSLLKMTVIIYNHLQIKCLYFKLRIFDKHARLILVLATRLPGSALHVSVRWCGPSNFFCHSQLNVGQGADVVSPSLIVTNPAMC